MTASTTAVGRVTSEHRGQGRFLLRFELRLPHPYEPVWAALATAEGLRGWLAAADRFERRIGGQVALRLRGTGAPVPGRVTAWDVEHVAEYTLAEPGRIRFLLEPAGPGATVVRFTNERDGTDADRLDALADWHDHFERLARALDGHPTDWDAWTGERRAELRAHYAGTP
ncbi:SRPBCC domain-containing protein [Streptomyces sp. NPDC002073]